MLIVDRPPSTKEFFIDSACSCALPSNDPWLIIADIVHYTDTALKVPIGRHILVMAARGTIVRKAQAVPITEVGVQEALICAVEAYASLCECQQSIVVAQIRLQRQHPTIEAIRPPNIGYACKVCINIEQFVWCSEGHHVRI